MYLFMILNSDQNDKCIGLTMICVCFSVHINIFYYNSTH